MWAMSVALSRRLTESSSKPASRSFLQIASSPAPTGDRGLAMAATLDLGGGEAAAGNERASELPVAGGGRPLALLFLAGWLFPLCVSCVLDGELGGVRGFYLAALLGGREKGLV
jgi:hypothetical protein